MHSGKRLKKSIVFAHGGNVRVFLEEENPIKKANKYMIQHYEQIQFKFKLNKLKLLKLNICNDHCVPRAKGGKTKKIKKAEKFNV